MAKPLQTNWNYFILIHPNVKSILTNFDGFDQNYGSICVFPQSKCFGKFSLHNRTMHSADVKKGTVLSRLRY